MTSKSRERCMSHRWHWPACRCVGASRRMIALRPSRSSSSPGIRCRGCGIALSVPVPTGSWPGRARPRPWWPRSGSTRQTAGAVLVRATPSVDAVSDGIPAPRSRSLTRALASPYGAPRSRRAASASGGVKVVRTVSAFARAAPSSRRWSRSTPSASGDVVDRSPAPALAAAVWACRLTSWLCRGHAHLDVAHGRLIQISSESFLGFCPTWANGGGEIPAA